MIIAIIIFLILAVLVGVIYYFYTKKQKSDNKNNKNKKNNISNGIYLGTIKKKIIENFECDSSLYSKTRDKNEIDFCSNVSLDQIFLVFCEDYDGSPIQYKEKVTQNDCPGRNMMTLYKNGKYSKPEIINDDKGDIITLKDLKADVGIDVSYNGENIRMSDIPFKDGIKTKCGLRYDLNIEHNGKNCIFELFINENYEDIIEEED